MLSTADPLFPVTLALIVFAALCLLVGLGPHIAKRPYAKWVAVSSGAGAIAFGVSFLVGTWTFLFLRNGFAGRMVTGGVTGAVIGVLQFVYLSRCKVVSQSPDTQRGIPLIGALGLLLFVASYASFENEPKTTKKRWAIANTVGLTIPFLVPALSNVTFPEDINRIVLPPSMDDLQRLPAVQEQIETVVRVGLPANLAMGMVYGLLGGLLSGFMFIRPFFRDRTK